jgi:predicted enzyme related to lactoylglutathione lyase
MRTPPFRVFHPITFARPTPMHGQFTWYDLNTSDVKAALSFYPALTGWGTEEWAEMEYTMWTVDGAPLGGVVQLTPEQKAQGLPNHWMPYVEVRDVDQSATQAESLGGKIWFGPQDIPGTGRFAVLSDPQGAVFAVYKPLEPGYAFDGTRHVGRFVWHELLTSDMDAAFDFYRQMFQWEETNAFDMGPDVGLYRMFGQKGGEYGGMFIGSGRMAEMPPFWTCYVHVKDVEKAAALATKRGGQVVNGPMEVPGGDVIAVIMDPQGAAFAIHQNPKAATTSPAPKTRRPSKKKSARKAAKRSVRAVKKAVKRSATKVKRRVVKAKAKVKRRVVKAKAKRRVVKAKVKRRVAKTKRTARRRSAKRRR